jgi:hypothetical protein
MLAAERDQVLELSRLPLDQRQAALDVAERQGEVADIRQRQGRRVHPACGMRAIHQHPRRRPDRPRPVPRAGAVGGADIHRDAGDGDGAAGIPARHAQEAGRGGVGGRSGHAGSGPASAGRYLPAAPPCAQPPRSTENVMQ